MKKVQRQRSTKHGYKSIDAMKNANTVLPRTFGELVMVAKTNKTRTVVYS